MSSLLPVNQTCIYITLRREVEASTWNMVQLPAAERTQYNTSTNQGPVCTVAHNVPQCYHQDKELCMYVSYFWWRENFGPGAQGIHVYGSVILEPPPEGPISVQCKEEALRKTTIQVHSSPPGTTVVRRTSHSFRKSFVAPLMNGTLWLLMFCGAFIC